MCECAYMLAPLNLAPILLLAHKFSRLNHIVDGAIAAICMAAGGIRTRTINHGMLLVVVPRDQTCHMLSTIMPGERGRKSLSVLKPGGRSGKYKYDYTKFRMA